MPSLTQQEFLKSRSKETAEEQAQRIFGLLEAQVKQNPNKKIALIYSANNGQAQTLHDAYRDNPNGDIPVVNGGGQAMLFAKLIPLINQSPYKNRFRVLPVATSLYGGENNEGNYVSTDMIKRDLFAIQNHLTNDFDVYGIPGVDGRYAIGGGISKHWFTTTYTSVMHKGTKKSQGDFVEEMLKALEKNIHFEFQDQFELGHKPTQSITTEKDPDAYLIALKVFKEQANHAKWTETKDSLYRKAVEYPSIDLIPAPIKDALRYHYNSVYNLYGFFNMIFERGETKHWRQVEQFFLDKNSSNTLTN